LVSMAHFSMQILVTASFVCVCVGCVPAAEVATQDGLTLGLGLGGEVVSCRVDDRELLRAGVRGAVCSLPT